MFLLLLLGFSISLFNPTILDEISSKTSPVCYSSTPPIRILNGFVYVEYFAAVGDYLYELACLIYNLLDGFDACDSCYRVAMVV